MKKEGKLEGKTRKKERDPTTSTPSPFPFGSPPSCTPNY